MDEILARAKVFHGLTAAGADALADEFELLYVERGSTVLEVGCLSEGLYVVLDGFALLTNINAQDQRFVVDVLGPADQFGEVALVDHGPQPICALAITDLAVARLRADRLRGLMIQTPQIALNLLAAMCRQMRRQSFASGDLVFLDARARTAKRLVQLARRIGAVRDGRWRIPHYLSLEDFAEYVCSDGDVVAQTLLAFENDGWIRREIDATVILKLHRLLRLAGGSSEEHRRAM